MPKVVCDAKMCAYYNEGLCGADEITIGNKYVHLYDEENGFYVETDEEVCKTFMWR